MDRDSLYYLASNRTEDSFRHKITQGLEGGLLVVWDIEKSKCELTRPILRIAAGVFFFGKLYIIERHICLMVCIPRFGVSVMQ